MKYKNLLAYSLSLLLCLCSAGCYKVDAETPSGIGELSTDSAVSQMSASEPSQEVPSSLPDASSEKEGISDVESAPSSAVITPNEKQIPDIPAQSATVIEDNSMPPQSSFNKTDSVSAVPGGLNVYLVESEMLSLINAERASQGVSALLSDSAMVEAARIRSVESIQEPSHIRPDGSPYYTVFDQVGFPYAGGFHGENISRYLLHPIDYTNESLARVIFEEFKASPGHYANMLRADYEYIGLAVTLNTENNLTYSHTAQLFGSSTLSLPA